MVLLRHNGNPDGFECGLRVICIVGLVVCHLSLGLIVC